MKPAAVVVFAVLLIFIPRLSAQTGDSSTFGRKNTFSAFFDYSNDSSHIVLGSAEGRKFTELGFQYERRLIVTPNLVWKYIGEFRPLIAESDLTTTLTNDQTSPPPPQTFVGSPTTTIGCESSSGEYSQIDPFTGVLFAGTLNFTCGRRWTYVEGLSPLGTRINLLPRRR
jgi:hypothetical protein